MVRIQVYGPGCSKCNKLAENARKAAVELGLEFTLDKVTDLNEMLKLGVMTTPALVVDGQVRMVGKAASVDHVKGLLSVPAEGKAGEAR